jgi:hypothetical protein
MPPGYGKGGKACMLALDGHTSRWCSEAMRLFKEANVYVWCLASHTSIWTQPNDLGINSKLKALFSKAYQDYLQAHFQETNGFNQGTFNKIFVIAWNRMIEEEKVELVKNKGSNVSTRSFARSGIFPLNRKPTIWCDAIQTIGAINGFVEQARIAKAAAAVAPPSPSETLVTRTGKIVQIKDRVLKILEGSFLRKVADAKLEKEERKKRKRVAGVPNTSRGFDCGVEGFLVSMETNDVNKVSEAAAGVVRKAEKENNKKRRVEEKEEKGKEKEKRGKEKEEAKKEVERKEEEEFVRVVNNFIERMENVSEDKVGNKQVWGGLKSAKITRAKVSAIRVKCDLLGRSGKIGTHKKKDIMKEVVKYEQNFPKKAKIAATVE